jgi:hypothetical protein
MESTNISPEYQLKVTRPDTGEVKWINCRRHINSVKYLKTNKYIRNRPEVDEELHKFTLDNNVLELVETVDEVLYKIQESDNFNDEQYEAIVKIIQMVHNKDTTKKLKSYISLIGPAGSGKSYTILNMFKYFKEIFKTYNICFCAPTNIIVQRCKEYEQSITPYFAKTEFLTISQLLGEKLTYDKDGNTIFKRYKKKLPLNDYDLVIVDESSMIEDEKIKTIIRESDNMCIFIGDKNQLNPVNEIENALLYNADINLIRNMRCSKKLLNRIFNYIICEINMFNDIENYTYNMYTKFICNLVAYLFKKKNDSTLFYYTDETEFINKFINNYKENDSIICNYTNKECVRINKIIKDILVLDNNIELIDNTYYIEQQLIFNRRYDNIYCNIKFNTSELIKIYKISEYTYNLYMIEFDDLYKINDEYLALKFSMDVDNFNERINDIDNLTDELLKIINVFNKLRDINTYKLCVYNKKLNKLTEMNTNISYYIFVLQSCDIYIHKKFIDDIKISIDKFKKKMMKKKYDNYTNSFIEDVIIHGLYKLLDRYRVNIFADVSDGFSSTCHKIQGNTIHTIFVNLKNILTMSNDDLKNKLKCIYTAMTRCSKTLVVYY